MALARLREPSQPPRTHNPRLMEHAHVTNRHTVVPLLKLAPKLELFKPAPCTTPSLHADA